MANSCTMKKHCGGFDAYWTNATYPEAVGTPKQIVVFGTHAKARGCYMHILDFLVLRCSLGTPYDIIYKFIGTYNNRCDDAMCGMRYKPN